MSAAYSLDSIVVRGRRVFGWGFCLHPDGPIARCRMRVPDIDGGESIIDLVPSGFRSDLRDAFPDLAHAAGAGFLVSAQLSKRIGRGDAALLLTTKGGDELMCSLPQFPDAYLAGSEVELGRGWSRFIEVVRRRGWMAAFRASCSTLASRLRRHYSERVRLSRTQSNVAIVFDHHMGGGANRYRQSRVSELSKHGFTVVVARPDLASLAYVSEWTHRDGRVVESRFVEQSALLEELDRHRVAHVEINNLVGFEDPLALLDWARAWRSGAKERLLRYQLHDFHAACPSFTLIGVEGDHCGLPSPEVCRRCLPNNGRHTLGLQTDVDVSEWRARWTSFLRAADERIAFSRVSVTLMCRALPEIADSDFAIQPHQTDVSQIRPVGASWADPVRVAAVGHLSHAKGASLVRKLAHRARERGLPIEFIVVGTLEGGSTEAGPTLITGSYRQGELSDVLERTRVGVVFLPSVCPETYSYLTDELMATGLPLVALDLGAPAERISLYPHGCLLPVSDQDMQLDTLMRFIARVSP
ncbi:MAG: hypothetical protein DDT26_01400 [Dehalococcoidia bacterium]|nr:hypothetical protein [Chloroflexota bacterium]